MSTLYISSGVTSSGLTVSGADTIEVLSGGTLQTATVDSGGAIMLSSGALVSSLTVLAGGAVSGPGQFGGVSLDAGSVTGVLLGGYPNYGANLEVQSGGSATGVVVETGDL